MTQDDDETLAPNTRRTMGEMRKLVEKIRFDKVGKDKFQIELADDGTTFKKASLDMDTEQLEKIAAELMEDDDYTSFIGAAVDVDKLRS